MRNIIIIIVIIIIRHQLDLDRPVSASSNNLYKDLPRRLRPFGLQFGIILAILFLFILVTWRSQFHLYLLRFSSTGSFFNSSEMSSFCGQKSVRGSSSEKFHLD